VKSSASNLRVLPFRNPSPTRPASCSTHDVHNTQPIQRPQKIYRSQRHHHSIKMCEFRSIVS
jgi:hypothetical protein